MLGHGWRESGLRQRRGAAGTGCADHRPLRASVSGRAGALHARWREWCTHDNQHVLRWGALDAQRGLIDLWEQIAWLAGVLAARDYPLDRLAISLELGAEVLDEQLGAGAAGAAQELRGAAGILAGYQASM
jgi:hypothetical protein